ncbi:MAG: FecR domain-containing protein [Myxococcota bacterium]
MTERSEELASYVSTEVDQLGVERIARRIQRTMQAPRASRPWGVVAVGLAATVALGLLLQDRLPPHAKEPALKPLFVRTTPPALFGSVRTEELEDLHLNDGSTLVVSADTELQVNENTGRHVDLGLRRGEALFDIVPNGPRRWEIDAGPLRVRVLGTRFRVVRSVRRVEVHVERGRVQVVGDDVSTVLEAGQSYVHELQPPSTPEPSTPTPTPVTREPQGPSWRELAERGDLDQARRVLGPGGIVRRARRTRSANDLFLLADIARRAGTAEEALALLTQIVREHPADPRTPLAAFTRGRILSDQLGRRVEGAEAFDRAARAGLSPDLAAIARRRAFEGYRRAGQSARARDAAERYLDHHPEGEAAPAVRRWLEAP